MSFHAMDSSDHGSDNGVGLSHRCGDCRHPLALLKNEFWKKNLWMTGDTSYGRVNWVKGFGSPRTRFTYLHGLPFLLWRFLLAGFAVFNVTWSIIFEEDDNDALSFNGFNYSFGYWLVFLTHWMLVVHTICAVFLFICTAMTYFKYKEDSNIWKTRNIPHYARVAWVTNIISLCGGLFVVLLYWLLLHGANDPLSIISHGGLWGAIVFDWLILGTQPYLLVQFPWPVIFAWSYGLLSVIWAETGNLNKDGNPWIYTPIKWLSSPGIAAFWAFGSPIVILIPMYVLFWGLCFFREQAIYRVESSAVATGGPIVQGEFDSGKV